MTRAELIETFRTTAEEVAERDFSTVDENSQIAELGIDSLGMLEIIGSMERELNVRVPDDALAGIQTVKQLIELVEERLS